MKKIAKKTNEQDEFPVPSLIDVGETVDAVIVRGYMATGEEIFGEAAQNPEQRRLVYVLSMGDGQEEVERSVPWKDPAGKNTSLGQLYEIYGKFPGPGDILKLVMGESGWRIAGLR